MKYYKVYMAIFNEMWYFCKEDEYDIIYMLQQQLTTGEIDWAWAPCTLDLTLKDLKINSKGVSGPAVQEMTRLEAAIRGIVAKPIVT